jgi:UDP-4-amino-4,6-dideoxy-N-acetyl-beta-L-altrosamine N-acetyltransferase
MTVTLRPLAAEDAALVVTWRSDPATHAQFFARDPPTLAGHARWFERYRAATDREEFVILADGQPVGTIGLSSIDRENRRAEYGILVGPTQARGHGVGREASRLLLARAFGPLELQRVYLHVFPDNLPAGRMYERVGFEREGLLRAHAYKDGRFRDVLVMGILEARWRAS